MSSVVEGRLVCDCGIDCGPDLRTEHDLLRAQLAEEKRKRQILEKAIIRARKAVLAEPYIWAEDEQAEGALVHIGNLLLVGVEWEIYDEDGISL